MVQNFFILTVCLTGFDALGEVATETCSNPETWNRTGFAYNKQYDQKTMSMKKTIAGPNSLETVYEMPFNENNLSKLCLRRESHLRTLN